MALVASAAMLVTGSVVSMASATTASADTQRDSYSDTVGNSAFESAREKYGLAQNMSEGATLHAWMWSFKTIEQNIPAIAEAGFTSVQTEPVSAIHAAGNGMKFAKNWYYVYQPTDTTVGNWVVGSESDLKSLCETAHKYGVRIIVDIVANHMTADYPAISSRWKNNDYYHHDCNNGNVSDWNNRYQVTHCKLVGLYDLNTDGNSTVGDMMASYLKQLVNDGVDGFRYDAAKHIELPGEYNNSSYWTKILANGSQYQYGEVLHDGISRDSDYAKLFASSAKGGGGITASAYGGTLRSALNSKNLNAGNLSSWDNYNVAASNLTSWVESHDTYANEDKESTGMSEWQMTMGWGVIGSRADTMSLYFDRPVGSGGSNPQFSEQTQLGDAGSTSWKDTQVTAVNHFRNAMNNEDASEYLRNCNDNSCLMVERYKSDGNADTDGVTVVNMGNQQSLAGLSTKLDDGTYTDQVNGGTLTVSGGKITSGTATPGKVSVFYNMKTNVASVSATGSASFKTDTTTVTLRASNVAGAKYTTSEGKSGSYNDGDTITVGANTAVGSAVTVTVSGTDADGKTVTATFTFQKKDPTAVTVVYAKKPSSWSNLDAYVYVDDPNAASVTQNAKWPGVAMTAADACGKNAGYDYMYEIPDNFEGTVRVIFNDGNATNTTKYPADSTSGEDAAGLQVTGTSAWNGDTSASTSGALKSVSCTTTTVKSVTISQSDFSLDVSNGATTKQLTATTDPAGASVTWSSSDDSVASVASDGTVTAKKAGMATITAKAGTVTASVKVTVTGTAPVAKNRIYVTKPSGWSSVYIYMYTGSGSSATSNAKWPGVAITAIPGTDTCGQSGYYYDVPDNLASNAKVIFSDNGNNSNRYPANMAPGMDYNGGTMSWTSGSTTLSTVTCKTPDVPVSSVAISGDGVSNGALSLAKGKSVQLSAAVSPSNATSRTVTWSSSDASVASVTGTGNVTAVKAGTATITATAGGKSASVKVTVTDPGAKVDVQSVSISGAGTVAAGKTIQLTATVSPSNATNKTVTWASLDPSVATVSSTGVVTGVKAGTTTILATAGGVSDLKSITVTGASVAKRPMDVWYKPASSVSAVRVWYRLLSSDTTGFVDLKPACDGFYRGSIPDTKGEKVKLVVDLSAGSYKWDAKGKDGYRASGSAVTLAYGNVYSAAHACAVSTGFAISGSGVSNGKLSLAKGGTAQLSAVNVPSGASTVTWWSDGGAVAVTGTGYVVGVKAGTCKVHVQAGGKSAVLTVTVK
ncbi:alpha-amylase [Bifidobacterium thermophilum]|nr:alpha-amylase [Bifidobacterium thermophilum]